MPKRSYAPGEHGDVECVPLKRVGDRWVKHQTSRGADSWRARVYFRGHDGMPGEVSARGRTRKEAESAARSRLQERLSGGLVEIRPSTPMVEVGAAWLRQIQRRDSGKKPSTVSAYIGAYSRYIDAPGSSLRGLTIGQANSVHRVRAFLQGVADGHGTGAARTSKTVLSGILGYALEGDAVPMNAALQVKPVKAERPKAVVRDRKRSFTMEERQHALAVAAEAAADDRLDPRTSRRRQAVADLMAFMSGTGVRIGEARGLRWEHLCLQPDDGKPFVNVHGTKSRASRRRLDLPTWLAQRLLVRADRIRADYERAAKYAKHSDTESRAQVVERLHRWSETVGTSGYVFGSPALLDPELAWDESNCLRGVRHSLDAAGLSWAVPHTFRRTVATCLSSANVPLARIADQLGHEDPAMTASVYLGRDFSGDKSDLAALL